jgi:hypothetical protein
MRTRHIALAAALAVALARGQETRQERGKRVVEEALAALGGEAFLHMEDRVVSGRAYSFYRSQISGLSVATIYTRYTVPAPGKLGLRERQAFGKKQDEGWLLFTDEGGWNVSYRGASPLPDETYTNYTESTERGILYILRQRWNEPGLSFYSEGRDTFENQPVDIVDITDATGFTVTVSFNQSTKLPVRQTYRRRNPIYKDFDTEVTVYTKYRTVDGIVWPYDIHRERNGDKVFELYADSVQMNKDLKDDLFTLPGKIKILPKGQ